VSIRCIEGTAFLFVLK